MPVERNSGETGAANGAELDSVPDCGVPTTVSAQQAQQEQQQQSPEALLAAFHDGYAAGYQLVVLTDTAREDKYLSRSTLICLRLRRRGENSKLVSNPDHRNSKHNVNSYGCVRKRSIGLLPTLRLPLLVLDRPHPM